MWNEILGGLAGGLGGLSEGLQQAQQDKLRQAQQRLQQQQYDLEVEQQKRRAVMEARQMLSGGMTVGPEQLKTFSQYPGFLAGIEKQSDGSFVVQKSKQEQLIDQQIREHELEVKEKQAQQEARDAIEGMGAGFYDLPDAEKMAWATKTGDAKFPIQTPEQALQHNAMLEKQRLASQSAADVARIRAQGQVDSAQTRARLAAEAAAKKGQLTWEDAAKIVLSDKDLTGQSRYRLGSPEFNQAVDAILSQANGQRTTTGRLWSNFQEVK